MEQYIIASNFLEYNFIFLIIFALVTMLVSIFSYRVYRIVRQDQLKLFSIAFLSISLGYLMQVIMHLFLDPRMLFGMRGMHRMMLGPHPFERITPEMILLNAHAILTIIGLSLLAYTTFKTKKPRLLALLLLLSVTAVAFTPKGVFTFHIISAILLFFVGLHFYENYRKHKQLQTALVMLAFVFLFCAHFLLMFSFQTPLSFTVGRIIELIGYLLILANLMLVLKK